MTLISLSTNNFNGQPGARLHAVDCGRLLMAVCDGRVGAVLAMEASRLARNNRDWHHLIDLCVLNFTPRGKSELACAFRSPRAPRADGGDCYTNNDQKGALRWLERRLVVDDINKDDPEWVTLGETLGPLVEKQRRQVGS